MPVEPAHAPCQHHRPARGKAEDDEIDLEELRSRIEEEHQRAGRGQDREDEDGKLRSLERQERHGDTQHHDEAHGQEGIGGRGRKRTCVDNAETEEAKREAEQELLPAQTLAGHGERGNLYRNHASQSRQCYPAKVVGHHDGIHRKRGEGCDHPENEEEAPLAILAVFDRFLERRAQVRRAGSGLAQPRFDDPGFAGMAHVLRPRHYRDHFMTLRQVINRRRRPRAWNRQSPASRCRFAGLYQFRNYAGQSAQASSMTALLPRPSGMRAPSLR